MVAEEIICMVVPMISAMMAVVVIYAARLKKVPPEKAMVVYGRKMAPGIKLGYKVMTQGGRLIMPIIESYELLDISPKTLELDLKDVKTGVDGVRANIKVSITYKVGEESALQVAAEHLLGLPEEEIKTIGRNMIEGTIRTVLRMMDDPDLEGKPFLVSDRVMPYANTDLLNIGLSMEKLTIERLRLTTMGGT